MNKQELIDAMASESGLSKKDTETALNAFVTTVQGAVKSNDKVTLVGFGTFELRSRAERKGRNPQTQEEITIPATKAPAFKAGKLFKDTVNETKTPAKSNSKKK